MGSCGITLHRNNNNMHSTAPYRGYGTFDSYEGCRGLYPATSRLQSVPPRFYDIIDGDTGDLLASDLTSGRNRARSMIRQTRLAEERAWPQPMYGDLVTGRTASAGSLQGSSYKWRVQQRHH